MTSKRFILFILVSLGLHLILVGMIALIQNLKPLTPPRQTVDVEFLSEKPSEVATQKKKSVNLEDRQVVDQDKKPLNNEEPDETKFVSAHNQMVKKETASQNRGEFKNIKQKPAQSPGRPAAESAPSKSTAQNTETKTPPKAFDPLAEMDQNFKKRQMENIGKNPEERQRAASAGGDVSQSQDYLKNVDKGLETLLKTKEFKYYTYFNRIRRQLSQHWEPKVREKLSAMLRQGRAIASDQDKITKLLITLNPAGNLVKVQVLGDSGVRDLDDAAVEAFRSAAPFPNPPKGIIDPDGTVKIRWDFILES